jgi:hypothetical protein
MKTIFISIITFIAFTMYCCIKVGADSEKNIDMRLDRPDFINTKNKKKDRSSR